MKIAIEVRVYNHQMRERRWELGLTQAALADLAGVGLDIIGKVERLQMIPRFNIGTARDKLLKIAEALEVPFGDVFPEDYLEMIRKELLPKSTRYQWVRDFSLDALPSPTAYPALMDTPNLSEEVELDELAETLGEAVKRLPAQQRRVIELRFGLNGEDEHTLEGAGRKMDITRERVRQLEYSALNKLRHPIITEKLWDHLDKDGGSYRSALQALEQARKDRERKDYLLVHGPRLEREARERRNKKRAEQQRVVQEAYDDNGFPILGGTRPDDSERTL